MKKADIIAMQAKLGVEPDGFWGPKSIAACQRHLSGLMPIPSPWPRADQSSMRKFYGEPGDNSVIINVPAPSWMRLYDTDTRVRTIACHKRVAESLLRALVAAYGVAPEFARRYFGCHVDRPMRGGTLPSTHAYGAAIDLSASTNRNKQHWPSSADMPLSVMEEFAKEGWMAAGAFWSRDAMHLEATSR